MTCLSSGAATNAFHPRNLDVSGLYSVGLHHPQTGWRKTYTKFDVGSNGADIVLNSDDTVCPNPSLDSEETVVATKNSTDGILSFANYLSGTSLAAQFLQSNEELEPFAALLNRAGAVSSSIEKTLSPTLPCELPPSPPTLWLPWSIYADSSQPAESSVWCIPPCSSGTALLDDLPTSEFGPQL
ncbi:hypothetical protein BGW80DRAFT_1256838 [Lactifluus volemus]|nr:hypothetical protein BGW80DRAFT_1256838 [Lactifluus volemus]